MLFPLCDGFWPKATFRLWFGGNCLVTLGNECRVAGIPSDHAKDQSFSGTDASEIRQSRIRMWNGNYLASTVLVKEVRSGKIFQQRGPNDPAIIGNAIQNGKQGMRMIQRCPLALVKNEAVNHAINAFIYSNDKAVVVNTKRLRLT